MKRLVSAEAILNAYGADEKLIHSIASDKKVLKDALITAISKTHPKLPNEVKDEQFIAVRKLDGFKHALRTLIEKFLCY